MIKNILLLVFSFFGFCSFGQNAKIDSLMNVLKTAKADTAKVNALNTIAYEFRNNNPDTAVYFAAEAMTLATKIKYKMGIADAYLCIGTTISNIGKYEEALNKLNDALNLYDQLLTSEKTAGRSNLMKQKGRAYNNMGLIFSIQGNYSEALKNHLASLKIKEKIGDVQGIAASYNNIGLVYWNQGNYPEALKKYFASLKISQEIGDKYCIAGAYINIGNIYSDQGNYPAALRNQFAALKISEEIVDKQGIANCYNNIGIIYDEQNNYSEALKNHFAALKISDEIGDKKGIADSYGSIGSIYDKQSNYPAALKYYFDGFKICKQIGDKQGIAASYGSIGSIYDKQGKYNEALKYYFDALKISEQIGDKQGVAGSYINIGIVYIQQKKNNNATQYLNSGLSLANEIGSTDDIKDVYSSLAKLDSAQGNFKEAFEHHKLYITYRDSLFNEENTKKLVQSQMQYDFDKKESATKAETDKKDALAKAEIGKQKIIRNSIAGGTGIVALSSIFSFLVYKRKREASFKNEVSEVEMKALRSQMNPHFIFNSLNSIKRYMANHDNKTAEDYLTKFANVMRLILENSEHKEVPLQQDLKALELYMQLESLRMKKKFIYEIKVDESIDQENTLIPPLILQPFVENSIWHGLAGKEGEGKISISINRVGEMIECIVEDNGVGREKAKTNNPEGASAEKKSLGMKITNARIDILNKIKKSKAGVELVDLAEGMKVVVRLPLELSF